ncbi:MAG: glycosyltransferase [Bacilli bacterium]|nr:glycosyltransferase [Bacilli bacterium]
MKILENTEDLISIIVPVYNVEKYVNKMITSIQQQTYSNFELILVDDGSVDDSKVICERISKEDERIAVYSQQNKGVSEARNLGISKAIGKYILFIDADDWIDETLIETYYNLMIKDSNDLVINEYNVINRNKSYSQKRDLPTGVISLQQALYKIINPKGFYGSVWGKLFSLEIIKKNHIKFNPTISIGEDLLFMIDYLQYCSKIVYNDNCLYNYLIRETSALNTVSLKRLDILQVYQQLLENNYLDKKIKKRICAIYVWECIDWQCRLSSKEYNEITHNLRKEAIHKIHIFLLNDVFNYRTKINTLVKLLVPSYVYKRKYKIFN